MYGKYLKISDCLSYSADNNPNYALHSIMLGKNPDIALQEMVNDNVLQTLIPGIEAIIAMKDNSAKKRFKDLWEHTKTVVKQTEPVLVLRWAALFHDFGKPDCFTINDDKIQFHNHEAESVKYFKNFSKYTNIFSKSEFKEICFLIYNLGYIESYQNDWTDSAVRRLDKKCGQYFDNLLLLSSADITTQNPTRKNEILNKINHLKQRVLEIREKDKIVSNLPKGIGNSIIDMGITSGQIIGELKQYLESEINAGTILANQPIEYYTKYLKEKISKDTSGNI